MKKQAGIILGLSIAVFIVITLQLIIQYPPTNSIAVDFGAFAGYGNALTGIFSIISVYLLYKTLTYQAETFNITQFENRVFELLRYHRENVEFTEMRNPNDCGEVYYKGHKAFREIYRQFNELASQVNNFLESTDLRSIYKDYDAFEKETLILQSQGIAGEHHKAVNVINIAYLILFFGVDKEGIEALKTKLQDKYLLSKLTKLLDNLSERIALWSINDVAPRPEPWRDVNGNQPYRATKIKFHGGHQYRLGHYFRHLFQAVSYIDNKGIRYNENYEYTKIVRAQLSSYEQKLLFVNSVSDLGRTWEIEVHKHYKENLKMDMKEYFKAKKLITKFDLVRNIPDDLGFIKISNIYPLLVFDGNRESDLRETLNVTFDKGYY